MKAVNIGGQYWELDYLIADDGALPDGGIILKNIRHDNYNLAKEIRVIGFWIEFETFVNGNSDTIESKFFPLDRAHFTMNEPLILTTDYAFVRQQFYDMIKKYGKYIFKPKSLEKEDVEAIKFYYDKYTTYLDILDSLQNFSTYHFIGGIQADFSLKNDFNVDNCEYNSLDIKQTYLFTDYQDSPAHEPSGGLTATRLFPLIKTLFKENSDFDPHAETVTRINSIRIDYKFHPCLDTFTFTSETQKKINEKTPQELAKTLTNKPILFHILNNKPQQAGVFIDEESPDYIPAFFSGFAAEQAVFKAVEKPLIYEIGGVGLAKGIPFYSDNEKQGYKTWDNIHWWGGYKNTHIPSAPGAFHALHLHWRWGGSVKGGVLPPTPEHGQESQFIDSGVPSNVLKDKRYMGFLGPLVHPKCWIQSVRFAVVKYNKEEDNNTTTKQFGDKFSDKVTNPMTNLQMINNGENLLLWYSVEIHRELILPEYTYEDISLYPGNTRVKISEEKLTTNLSGTVFIHGLFFAHEEEPADPPMTVGSTTVEYIPSTRGKNKIIRERKFLRDVKF